MQDVIADFARCKTLFIIEEVAARMIDHMRFLAMRHRDVGVLIEMVMECAGAAFLRAGHDEVQAVYAGRFRSKHDLQGAHWAAGPGPLEVEVDAQPRLTQPANTVASSAS